MSGVNLRYVASSGNIYGLQDGTLKPRRDANFHDWAWTPSATPLQYGTRVSAFTRPAKVYDATLTLFGTDEEKLAYLEKLHDDFELDVRNVTPGRLMWKDSYIECYVTSSKTAPDDSNILVNNQVAFYCPHPFWIKEETRSFQAQTDSEEEPFLDYPYDYPYDYYSGGSGSAVWPTDFPFKSDFRMTIYGPAANPKVTINGYGYQILDTLDTSEYVTIDTKLGTIEKTTALGQKVNAFDLRNKEESVFEQLPPGTLSISWPGTFGFDLTLYEERSEPR